MLNKQQVCECGESLWECPRRWKGDLIGVCMFCRKAMKLDPKKIWLADTKNYKNDIKI